MRCRLAKILLPIIVLSSLCVQVNQAQFHWTVTGRAVDASGKPVPFARILIRAAEPRDGLVGSVTTTDEQTDVNGQFHYRRQSSSIVRQTVFLYVTSSFPSNALYPLNLVPPFTFRRTDQAFNGRLLNFRTDEEVNVGDIAVQVRYGKVVINLHNRKGEPMFTEAEDWNYVGIRVRDRLGKRVEEFYISPASVESAVRVKDSAIAIGLPEGQWYVDIAPDGEGSKWIKSDMLEVQASEIPTQITLKCR